MVGKKGEITTLRFASTRSASLTGFPVSILSNIAISDFRKSRAAAIFSQPINSLI